MYSASMQVNHLQPSLTSCTTCVLISRKSKLTMMDRSTTNSATSPLQGDIQSRSSCITSSFAGNDDLYGMSPVEVAAMLIDVQKAGQKWNLGLLNNMARPGGAWVTDALLGDTEYKGLKE